VKQERIQERKNPGTAVPGRRGITSRKSAIRNQQSAIIPGD
jgi:hypothetical protein